MLLKIIDRLKFYLIYKRVYKKRFKYYGDNITWGPHFKRLVIPKSIRISKPEKIIIESNCQFDEFVSLQCHYEAEGITIKRGTRCNAFTHIQCYSKITIEESVLVAPFTLISSGNHGVDDLTKPIMDQPHTQAGTITIGHGSWIGHGAKILGDCEIGSNSVVAAGAIIPKGRFPKGSIIAGNPAKVVREIAHDQ